MRSPPGFNAAMTPALGRAFGLGFFDFGETRGFGESIPDEGCMHVRYDDSIIQDVAAEKVQDMAEVGVTMHAWEYRQKWYGEDEKTAKARARGLAKGKEPKDEDA